MSINNIQFSRVLSADHNSHSKVLKNQSVRFLGRVFIAIGAFFSVDASAALVLSAVSSSYSNCSYTEPGGTARAVKGGAYSDILTFTVVAKS